MDYLTHFISLIHNKYLIKIINEYLDYRLVFEDELIYKTIEIASSLISSYYYKTYRSQNKLSNISGKLIFTRHKILMGNIIKIYHRTDQGYDYWGTFSDSYPY